jgi:SAM-dependent methyltransferase
LRRKEAEDLPLRRVHWTSVPAAYGLSNFTAPIPVDPRQVLRDFEIDDLLVMALTSLPRPPARILDIGCGSGILALALQNRGYEVLAIDEDPEMVAAAEALGVRAVSARFPAGLKSKFDGIIFSQSLHHIHDGNATVDATSDLLSPKGVVVVEEVGGTALPEEARNFLSETLGLLELMGVVDHVSAERRRWPESGPFDNWEVYFGEAAHPAHSGEGWAAEFERSFAVGEIQTGPFLYRLMLPFLPRTDRGVDIARAVIYTEKQRIQDRTLPALGLRWTATSKGG